MSQNAENLMRFYLFVVGMGIGCVIIAAIKKLCKIVIDSYRKPRNNFNRRYEMFGLQNPTNTGELRNLINAVAPPVQTPRARNPRPRTKRATPKSTGPTEQAESVAIQSQPNTGVALAPMLPMAPTQPLTPVIPETSVIEQTPILDESEINVDELK